MLSDHGIIRRLEDDSSFVENYVLPNALRYNKCSRIQPATLDLSLGHIFLPNSLKNSDRLSDEGKLDHDLAPGETVIVSTLEAINMPSDIAGIGFPPARMARDGILMTNPGHIDPGFKGHLHFTLINMGRSNYELKRGNIIFSIALFEISGAKVKCDYSERGNTRSGEAPDQKYLGALSNTFFDFKFQIEQSSRKIFEQEFKNRDIRAFIVGFASVIVAVALSNLWVIGHAFDAFARISKLEDQISKFETQAEKSNTQ